MWLLQSSSHSQSPCIRRKNNVVMEHARYLVACAMIFALILVSWQVVQQGFHESVLGSKQYSKAKMGQVENILSFTSFEPEDHDNEQAQRSIKPGQVDQVSPAEKKGENIKKLFVKSKFHAVV